LIKQGATTDNFTRLHDNNAIKFKPVGALSTQHHQISGESTAFTIARINGCETRFLQQCRHLGDTGLRHNDGQPTWRHVVGLTTDRGDKGGSKGVRRNNLDRGHGPGSTDGARWFKVTR
jgi:hypothetical protein